MANSDDQIRLRNEPLAHIGDAESEIFRTMDLLEGGPDHLAAAAVRVQLAHSRALLAVASAILHHTTHLG